MIGARSLPVNRKLVPCRGSGYRSQRSVVPRPRRQAEDEPRIGYRRMLPAQAEMRRGAVDIAEVALQRIAGAQAVTAGNGVQLVGDLTGEHGDEARVALVVG